MKFHTSAAIGLGFAAILAASTSTAQPIVGAAGPSPAVVTPDAGGAGDASIATAEISRADSTADTRIQAMESRLRTLEAELARRPARPIVTAPRSEAASPIANASQGTSHPSTPANPTLSGYTEVFYQWNFNNPSNGITNFRGFDNRHNTFTLSNIVLDANGSLGPVSAHLALQVGHTPETYYLAEPTFAGAGGAGPTNSNVWKFIQQALVSWRAPLGRGLLIEAGIFLSPVGPEGMAVHDQWNWSRSNLFFGLPFYHTGARVSYPLTGHLTLSLAGYNGWNSVVDNNPEKSVSAAFDYVLTDRVTFHLLYLGGVERSAGAPERQNGSEPWRHLFDAYVAVYPRPWLSLLAHANTGFELNVFGVSAWSGGALYARVQPAAWLFIAGRADFFYETVPRNGGGTAAPIFWPSAWVSSQTATLDARPAVNVSIRLEYRHDQAAEDTYFRAAVAMDPATLAFIPNAPSQDTLTLGMTAWF